MKLREKSTPTPVRILNRDARQYVESRIPFEGTNLYSELTEHGYVVYSHDHHHALLVAIPVNGQTMWFANRHKYSRTTTRHLNQCLPKGADVTWIEPHKIQMLIDELIYADN